METQSMIFIVFIFLIAGFTGGYIVGFGSGIDWAVDIGLNLIDIDIDEEAIKQGIFNYQRQIGNCFETNDFYLN